MTRRPQLEGGELARVEVSDGVALELALLRRPSVTGSSIAMIQFVIECVT